MVGLVLFTAALVGGQWASISSVRGDIAAIITRMDAQKEIDTRDKVAAQREVEAEKRILDGRQPLRSVSTKSIAPTSSVTTTSRR